MELFTTLREQQMGPHMTKFYLDHVKLGMPGACVLHKFTAPDNGDFHDHPWDFNSHILFGGYTEEVMHFDGRMSDMVEREEGAGFFIHRCHAHRIVRLHTDVVWTVITPKGLIFPNYFYRRMNEGLHRRLDAHGSAWEPYARDEE